LRKEGKKKENKGKKERPKGKAISKSKNGAGKLKQKRESGLK